MTPRDGSSKLAGMSDVDESDAAASRSKTRWVQYDVPMLIRVDEDEEGYPDISKIVLVADAEFINPFRDMAGQYRVYDNEFNEVASDERVREVIQVAEQFRHRHPLFPMGNQRALEDVWEVGPSPAIDPDYYLTDDELAALDAAYWADEGDGSGP